MDEYSRTGPKTYRSEAEERHRATIEQMRELLAVEDEEKVRQTLKEVYGLDPQDPKAVSFMKIWRDARQQSRDER